MARIANVVIPDAKQIQISLTYIYGIGPVHAKNILDSTKIDPTTRVKDLTEADLKKLRDEVDSNYMVEGDLRVVSGNVKRLKDIGSYRGIRHKNSLPSRGQRTRTNGRTRRGKRVAIGGSQPKAATKT